MNSLQSIREHLDRIIVAGGPMPWLRKQWGDRYPSASRPFRRQATKASIAQAAEYRRIRHWGKFRRAVMLGALVLGRPFVVELEQAGLLLAEAVPRQDFSTCLRDLARQLADGGDGGLAHLADRVRTYRAFDELASAINERGEQARRLLAERPFPFGRTLIGFTTLYFLRQHFAFEVGKEFEELFAEHRTPERLAEVASTIIALANEHRPLESADFTFPLSGIDVSADFISVLRHGAAICALREAGKLICTLNYELVRQRAARPRVYRLSAPSHELEYALRLGYIRGEIGTTASLLRVSQQTGPLHSMLAATENLLGRWPQIVELKDPNTANRRIRLQAPFIPELYETLSRARFYEDALREERLSQELELPMRIPESGSWPLVPGIDLDTFQKAWRSLEFMARLDITALRRYESDPVVIYNSLMRVSTEENLIDLLKVVGVEPGHVPAFLDLIAANVRRLGHYDMQYRPFLRVNPSTLWLDGRHRTTPPEIFHSSPVVASANVTANVQRAHGIRIRTNADAFVAIAEAMLKSVFKDVRTNVPVTLGKERTDVDIMVLTERTLYLIECKHSLTPTGAHELRDLWRDINHGVYQLKLAMEVLGVRLQSYLAGLFPGTRKAQSDQLRLQPCVLCSHRVFSGLSVEGIPVRDFASLALICGDGVVGMGAEDGSGHVVMQRYRLRENQNAAQGDFDEYLADRSRFSEMFRPFMHEYDRLDTLFGGSLVLAYNTFVHFVWQDEWAAHLERIGAISMSSERHRVDELRPIVPNKESAANI